MHELIKPQYGHNEPAEKICVVSRAMRCVFADRRIHIPSRGRKKSGIIDHPGKKSAQ
jgi:hypothetical protein